MVRSFSEIGNRLKFVLALLSCFTAASIGGAAMAQTPYTWQSFGVCAQYTTCPVYGYYDYYGQYRTGGGGFIACQVESGNGVPCNSTLQLNHRVRCEGFVPTPDGIRWRVFDYTCR